MDDPSDISVDSYAGAPSTIVDLIRGARASAVFQLQTIAGHHSGEGLR
jgi:hypothetical protein